MKIRFTMLFLCTMFAVAAFAQKPEALVLKTDSPPAIGGDIDAVWDDANAYDIVLPFQAEVTSLGNAGETTFKALWADDGIYVLVTVADDVYYPWYVDDAIASEHWKFDMVEIYFDCNYLLEDGMGTSGGENGNLGHYQFSADFVQGEVSGEVQEKAGWQFAALVEDPNYFIEYFLPFDKLLDENSVVVDKTAPIGFDAYVIDNDDVPEGHQHRAVWTNIGGIDQAWANMDECGIMLLDGADPPVYVESITLEDATIDENNGTTMIVATVLPEDASSKLLNYTLENGANGTTGRASVAADGTITGIVDGEVIVTGAATDGSYEEASCTLTISKQIVTIGEINVIKNGTFDKVNADGTAEMWGGWIDIPGISTQVVDGVANMFPDPSVTDEPQQWKYQFLQEYLEAIPNVEYEFGFVAWADDDVADFPVDFEDISGNSWNRYGATTSAWSPDGRSEWHIPITSIPTKYAMDVTFDAIVENTIQKMQFMPGLIDVGTVYVDSVYLLNLDDLALITDYTPVESIVVSGDATVAVDATAQMAAVVAPANALLTDVRWSVVNGTGEATIDADGLLTGVADGLVSVVATAKDDSGVTGVMDVTIGVVGISQKSVETLKVYPNPAVNELNVVLNSENATVSIYNALGQRMEQVVVSGTEYKFDISKYAAGIYFVKTGTSIAKFVK